MVVEIVGGPKDGQVMQIPDGSTTVKFPIQRHPFLPRDQRADISVQVIELPVVLTRNGWRIYWVAPRFPR